MAGGTAARRRRARPPAPRRPVRRCWLHLQRSGPARHRPDRRSLDLPMVGQGEHLVDSFSGVTKAIIRSCDSDISSSPGVMSCSRRWTLIEVDVHAPCRRSRPVSDVAQLRPAAPRSWMATTRPRSYSSRHASISFFSSNGIADLDVGSLLLVPFVERGRGEDRCSADPVTPRGVAEQDGDRSPLRRLPTGRAALCLQDAERHHVDEGVASGVAVGELDLTAERRHSRRRSRSRRCRRRRPRRDTGSAGRREARTGSGPRGRSVWRPW